MQATNTANPPEPLLTASEQAWLDACPVGDSRSLTKTVGEISHTATVDRRFSWGAVTPTPVLYGPHGTEFMPTEPTCGTGNPPLRMVTVTSP